MLALDSQTLLIAFNDAPDSRSYLTLATSCNGGASWKRIAVLEDDPAGSFSYPTLQDLPHQVRQAFMYCTGASVVAAIWLCAQQIKGNGKTSWGLHASICHRWSSCEAARETPSMLAVLICMGNRCRGSQRSHVLYRTQHW